MDNHEKNEELRKLLTQLANDMDLDTNIKKYVEAFSNIYTKGFRHEYSMLTKILFSIENIDGRDVLPDKIRYVSQNISDENILKNIRKLCDHIDLENIRMANLMMLSKDLSSETSITKNIIMGVQQETKSIQEETSRVNKQLEIIQEDVKSNTTQSITILSIFAGIVMAFSGGMSFISNAISGINKIGPYRLAIFILLIGNIMFNIIFLLIYMIGKVIGKYTGSNSQCVRPKKPCESKTATCYIVKYPYIIWFNFVDIVGIVISLYLDFIDRFDIFTKVIINGQYDVYMYSAIVLLAILGGTIGVIFYKLYKCNCIEKKLKIKFNFRENNNMHV